MRTISHSRRSFISNGLLSVFALPLARYWNNRPIEVNIILEGRANDLRNELVNFGLPLPVGLLNDARNVSVLAEDGTEIAAAVRSLEPWRLGGTDGTIRSLLIQFRSDFSSQNRKGIKVRFHQRRQNIETKFEPVSTTLIDEGGL